MNLVKHEKWLIDRDVIKSCRELTHMDHCRTIRALQHIHILHLQLQRETYTHFPHLEFQVIACLVQVRNHSLAHHILHRRDVEH